MCNQASLRLHSYLILELISPLLNVSLFRGTNVTGDIGTWEGQRIFLLNVKLLIIFKHQCVSALLLRLGEKCKPQITKKINEEGVYEIDCKDVCFMDISILGKDCGLKFLQELRILKF